MPHTFKTQVEGKEVDVELPEGYATPDEFQSLNNNFQATKRQFENLKKSQLTPEKAIEDPAFIKSVFEAKNVPFDEETLDFKLPEKYKDEAAVEAAINERLAKKEQAWNKSKLAPLQETNEKLSTKLSSTREVLKRMMIEQSARKAGVADAKFTANPFDGSAAVHNAASLFNDFDPTIGKEGNFVIKRDDTVLTDKTGTPITPDNYWDHFKAENHDNVDLINEWFPKNRQGGSNFSHGGGGGGAHTISAQDAQNHQKWKQAKEAADKAGVELRIT